MKKIIYDKHLELLDFIKSNVKKGYDIYSNTEDINELIDIIVKWYEFKYPDIELIKIIEFQRYNEAILNFNNICLFSNMGYFELMKRIPKSLHPIIECWYTNDYICIELKRTCNIVKQKININRYDGSFKEILDFEILKNLNLDCKDIDDFLNNNNGKNIDEEFNLDQPKKLAFTHNLNLELRKRIFNLIALKLLDSSDNLGVGAIRSKMFIEEFNKYIYDLNLNTDEIDKILDDNPFYRFSEVGEIEKINYLKRGHKTLFSAFNDENHETEKIEELGFSYAELCRLDNLLIHTVEDLVKKSYFNSMNLIEYSRSYRDKRIHLFLYAKEKINKKISKKKLLKRS